jgi:type II secretory pathway component PulJ
VLAALLQLLPRQQLLRERAPAPHVRLHRAVHERPHQPARAMRAGSGLRRAPRACTARQGPSRLPRHDRPALLAHTEHRRLCMYVAKELGLNAKKDQLRREMTGGRTAQPALPEAGLWRIAAPSFAQPLVLIPARVHQLVVCGRELHAIASASQGAAAAPSCPSNGCGLQLWQVLQAFSAIAMSTCKASIGKRG